MKNKYENSDDTFHRFYDREKSEDLKRDIEFADGVFNSANEPEPCEDILNSIKEQIRKETSAGKIHLVRYAAAAILLIAISLSGVLYFKTSTGAVKSGLSAKQWNSTNLEIDDKEFLEIQTELNNISSQLSDFNQNGYSQLSNSISELQSDFEKFNNNLWKG